MKTISNSTISHLHCAAVQDQMYTLLLQRCAAPDMWSRWQSGGNHAEYVCYNSPLLFGHKCDFLLPCTLPSTSISFRWSMSKPATLYWKADWWLKSCEGKLCIWNQFFFLFPNLLHVALMHLNIWAIAFNIVLAKAAFADLASNRLFSQQSTTSCLFKEEISPTLFVY